MGFPTPDPQSPKPGREPGTHDNSIAPSKGDRDQPYQFGRAERALRSSVDDWTWCRLLLLKGRWQDETIERHIHPEGPDGLCQ